MLATTSAPITSLYKPSAVAVQLELIAESLATCGDALIDGKRVQSAVAVMQDTVTAPDYHIALFYLKEMYRAVERGDSAMYIAEFAKGLVLHSKALTATLNANSINAGEPAPKQFLRGTGV